MSHDSMSEDYRSLRLRVAAECMAALLPQWQPGESLDAVADLAITAAESLLDRLGFVDPDATRG